MKIVTFVDNSYHKENLFGLLAIAKGSNRSVDFILIADEIHHSICIKEDSIFDEIVHVSTESYGAILKHILTSDVVLGMPSTSTRLSILRRLAFSRFAPLYLGLGKATKSVDYCKHPKNGHFNQLKTFLKFVALITYNLVDVEKKRRYTAPALSFPLGKIIVTTLPNYFYVKGKLSSVSDKDRLEDILFAR